MEKIISILLLTLLIGCVSSRFTSRGNVQIKRDDFSGETTYLGVTNRGRNGKSVSDIKYNYFLRSWKNKKDGTISHQLYVHAFYIGDWRYFNRASFRGGKEAELLSISKDVISCTSVCSYEETFGIVIPESKLKTDNTMQVKAYAKSGDDILITLTKQQVSSQIRAIK